MKVKDCMCHEVNFVMPNCSVKDCAKLMNEQHIGCVPVCDEDKKIIGIVTDRDIILRSVACEKDNCKTPVSDIMTCKVCCCEGESTIEEAENLMSKNQIRRLPIVENDKIVGIVTIGDLSANKGVQTQNVGCTMENICSCDSKNAE